MHDTPHKREVNEKYYFAVIYLFFPQKNYGPIIWIEIIGLKAAKSLRSDSLPLTTKSGGVPGTQLNDLTNTEF